VTHTGQPVQHDAFLQQKGYGVANRHSPDLLIISCLKRASLFWLPRYYSHYYLTATPGASFWNRACPSFHSKQESRTYREIRAAFCIAL